MTLASRVCSALLLAGVSCLVLSGCGSKPVPFADTAEGTLTWANKPLAGVRVQFVPQGAPGAQATLSSATTDEKGFFQLKRDDNGQPGAVIGKHKVVLMSGRMGGGRSRATTAGRTFARAPRCRRSTPASGRRRWRSRSRPTRKRTRWRSSRRPASRNSVVWGDWWVYPAGVSLRLALFGSRRDNRSADQGR